MVRAGRPIGVTVTVKGPLLAGPIGERMAVFDYNLNRDLVFPPATPKKDGTFPEYDLDDMRFHQLNTYAIAARATELVEHELGRPLRWGFEGSRLLVVPHAGTLDNAFYSAESHSLQFYSFMAGKRASTRRSRMTSWLTKPGTPSSTRFALATPSPSNRKPPRCTRPSATYARSSRRSRMTSCGARWPAPLTA